MLAPSKAITTDESTLYKASKLGPKITRDIPLMDLFNMTKRDFKDLSDFIDALDLLFILGKVDLDEDKEIIKIA